MGMNGIEAFGGSEIGGARDGVEPDVFIFSGEGFVDEDEAACFEVEGFGSKIDS